MLIIAGIFCSIFMTCVVIWKCFSADRVLRNRHRIILCAYAFGTWLVLSEDRPEKAFDASMLQWGFIIWNVFCFLVCIIGEWDDLVSE